MTVRVRGTSGRWLGLHASPLGDEWPRGRRHRASLAADLVPIILESYGLTQRESRSSLSPGPADELIVAEPAVTVTRRAREGLTTGRSSNRCCSTSRRSGSERASTGRDRVVAIQ